jgi:putative methanogenesis marker 16 metalloprotein
VRYPHKEAKVKKRRTLAEIKEKVEKGAAVVMTADELCNSVRSGEDVSFEDVDVVTSATCGLKSGTFSVLSFKVAEREEFERASKVFLNGVPAFAGPCPNERLGIIDAIVYGTSRRDEKYGGGHLFRELVAGEEIEVVVETVEGRRIETTTNLEEIPFARLCGTRNAFKNYYAFVNPHEDEVASIFSVSKFEGAFKELTFSGCGELNPLEKDPFMDTIGVGTKILMNGAEGFVIGEGTRSSAKKPNLMGIADMHGMLPEYLGGFRTSAGPEVWNSWAVPIPVLNERVLENAKRLDEEIQLGVLDVHNRLPVGEITYADVWRDCDLSVRFDEHKCIECEECLVASMCPTDAFDILAKEVNADLCCNCGVCVRFCEGSAFYCNLGVVTLSGREIPVTLRQSDRKRAAKLAEMLKRKILDADFTLSEPAGRL